jgi:hypothetical protein
MVTHYAAHMANDEPSATISAKTLAELLAATPVAAPRPFYLVLVWEASGYNTQVVDQTVIGAIETYPYARPLTHTAFIAIRTQADAVAIRSVLDYIADKVHPGNLLFLLSPPLRASGRWGGRVNDWPSVNQITDREQTEQLPAGELREHGT